MLENVRLLACVPRVFQDNPFARDRALRSPSHKKGVVNRLAILVAVRS